MADPKKRSPGTKLLTPTPSGVLCMDIAWRYRRVEPPSADWTRVVDALNKLDGAGQRAAVVVLRELQDLLPPDSPLWAEVPIELTKWGLERLQRLRSRAQTVRAAGMTL